MTREMNKPDWHNNWKDLCTLPNIKCCNPFYRKCNECNYEYCVYWNKTNGKRERVLNPDIAEFFWNCCKMEKLK